VISTLLFAAFLVLVPGIDPLALRQELDSVPWRPLPETTAAAARIHEPVEPALAKTTPAPTAQDARETPPARLDAQGGWQLQLAALANPDVARKEQMRLEKELGAGSIVLHLENGLTKLRWGRFPSREAADAARAELRAYRLDGFPVKTPASP
jgi:cell division septation protein DedD